MKYSTEIEIEKPIDEVIRLFDDPANLAKWMEGLQQVEYLSGVPGQPGAVSRLKFKVKKREFNMTETIINRNPPHEFSSRYETAHVTNLVYNRFVKLAANKTLYISENELLFRGITNILGFLMPGAFQKQSYQYQLAFKKFVEEQPSTQ
jgi:uncharacterized membrane protein